MIDMNKKYITVNGLPVRLLCVDRRSSSGYPVLGLIEFDGVEEVHYWDESGDHHSCAPVYSLIEDKPPVVSFHPVYMKTLGADYPTFKRAWAMALRDVLGILEITHKGNNVTTKFHPKE